MTPVRRISLGCKSDITPLPFKFASTSKDGNTTLFKRMQKHLQKEEPSTVLQVIYDDMLLYDIVIRAPDGDATAHKVVLAASSSVF